MVTDDRNTPDPEVVENLVKWIQDDAEFETRRQEIDIQRAELYAQFREARQRGDEQLCEELQRRLCELLEARHRIG